MPLKPLIKLYGAARLNLERKFYWDSNFYSQKKKQINNTHEFVLFAFYSDWIKYHGFMIFIVSQFSSLARQLHDKFPHEAHPHKFSSHQKIKY